MVAVKKNDFVELKYTGYANENIFDSNIEDDLKKLDAKSKPIKTIVSVGNEMLVRGFDKALEGKEVGKEYEVKFGPKEGFGERDRKLLQVIPLKEFHSKNINPQPGMSFAADDRLVKVVAVSGARVTVDFNSPLAGKEIKYKFTISRKVEDEKEKCDALFSTFFRFLPNYEIKDKSVVVKGPKGMDMFVNAFKEKFKELIGKSLEFEEVKIEVKKDANLDKKEEVI